jgi:transcriptional regulator with XRE-family HTH domain
MIDEGFIEKVKALRAKGWKQDEIAVELGVSQGTISKILRAHGLSGYLVKLKRFR